MKSADSPPAAPRRPADFAGDARVPVVYSRMEPMLIVSNSLRLGASRFHRSEGFLCTGFHKPISKCFPPAAGAPGGEDS